MTGHERLRVIYIAGYGRSGSTVLDISLAEHPSVFGAGEISALTHDVWIRNEFCSCGSPVQECALWSAIVREWLDGQGPSLIQRYYALQRKFESISGPFRHRTWLNRNRDFDEYAQHTLRLYRAIASVTGQDTIVDSSKVPGRAFCLSLIEGVDLYVVQLVRDPRAVAWSLLQSYERDLKAGLQKRIEPKSAMRTAVRWGLANLATEWFCRNLPTGHFTRVRYEDFTADPERTLRSIGEPLAIDFGSVARSLKEGKGIGPGHHMAGNRLRMKGAIRLIQDSAWKDRMPVSKQNEVRRLCGPLLKRYDYL